MNSFAITEPYYLIAFYILSGIVGLCVGSFLNVVIYRCPRKMNLSYPASHCPNCNYQLKWYDNIPVLSYLMLGGKCRSCKQHITFRYTIVEIANAVLWLACAFLFKDNFVYALAAMAISSICIVIFFIDLEHMIILDRFQIMMLVLAVVVTVFDTYYAKYLTTSNTAFWLDHIIGMLVAALVNFILVFVMNHLLKKETLGGGDIKFIIISGLLLGWERFIIMMIIASVSACIVMLIRMKKHGNVETPFAPFLTIGLLTSLFFGYQLLSAYFGLVTKLMGE